jgi:uncharacterized protein (DUF779 family)
MRVHSTPKAQAVVRRVAESGRDGLVLVLGSGCCDSTAPFLYDRYEVSGDSVRVGDVAGVPVFAPGWLAAAYGEDGLEIDANEGAPNDSFSLESEFDCRLTLRAP